MVAQLDQIRKFIFEGQGFEGQEIRMGGKRGGRGRKLLIHYFVVSWYKQGVSWSLKAAAGSSASTELVS
jgi:hypothetical protein